jgi:hypothetical protein
MVQMVVVTRYIKLLLHMVYTIIKVFIITGHHFLYPTGNLSKRQGLYENNFTVTYNVRV